MTDQPHVIEVGADDFDQRVVEASYDQPVVVDFWAPWCGPCRTLGPRLEKLAREAGGDWVLAKANVDDNQSLAGEYGIRGIPAVKAFVDAEIVDDFTGVLPRAKIQQWIRDIVPSATDDRVGQGRQAERRGQLKKARQTYRQVLDDDPEHPAALMGMARISTEGGDLDEARQWLKRVPAGDDGADSAEFQRLWFKVRAAELDDDIKKLRSRVDDTTELEARFDLAVALAAAEDDEAALEQLVAIVERDRHWRDHS